MPGGVFLVIKPLKILRGNIITGGNGVPLALMMQHVVTSVPRSPLVTVPAFTSSILKQWVP